MTLFVVACAIALIQVPLFAQSPTSSPNPASIPSDSPKPTTVQSPAAAPSRSDEAEMMKQIEELSKLNENHKLLASLAGNWNYVIKLWMNPDPSAPPQESKGTATTKPVMGGRYFVMDAKGTIKMPGPDGKIKDIQFKGMGIDGYDNVKEKFISAWIDNMTTGIELSQGTYDPATKTFTYNSEIEPVPGMKSKVREVMKIVDNDHHTFEWYEGQGGQERKTMEISYTRKK
jgi:hypothetical protein